MMCKDNILLTNVNFCKFLCISEPAFAKMCVYVCMYLCLYINIYIVGNLNPNTNWCLNIYICISSLNI